MDRTEELARIAPLVDATLAAQVHERWDVKTGADPGGLIDRSSVTQTAIAELIALPVPAGLNPHSPRQAPVEATIYQLSATLTAYKLEADQDYHLVLSDANQKTMIAEIPDPAALDPGSAFKQEIAAARQTFTAKFQLQIQALQEAMARLQAAAQVEGAQAGVVAPMIAQISIPVTVTGIGFFDFAHGQLGVAPNCIELHPVLSVAFPA